MLLAFRAGNSNKLSARNPTVEASWPVATMTCVSGWVPWLGRPSHVSGYRGTGTPSFLVVKNGNAPCPFSEGFPLAAPQTSLCLLGIAITCGPAHVS